MKPGQPSRNVAASAQLTIPLAGTGSQPGNCLQLTTFQERYAICLRKPALRTQRDDNQRGDKMTNRGISRGCALGGKVAAVAAFSLVGISSPANAESQAGGLPDVSARVLVLEGIATTLQTLVATLQSNVASLQTANVTLQNALNTEIATRLAGDNALQTALAQEASARSAADIAAISAIIQEATTRRTEDDALRSALLAARGKAFSIFNHSATLVNGARAVVGSLGPLPAGNYMVTSRASFLNFRNNAVWDCQLVRNDGVFIDAAFSGTESKSAFEDFGPSEGHVVNIALTTLGAAGSVKMFCGTDVAGSELFDIAMVAVQVGEAAIACPNLAFACPPN
jgi:hypothetical protein